MLKYVLLMATSRVVDIHAAGQEITFPGSLG